MIGNSEFLATLSKYPVGIEYMPREKEVSPLDLLVTLTPRIVYTIQPRASLIPASEAAAAERVVGYRHAFILIPGRHFDAAGTRHGTGGGWYDRFLGIVPHTWLRIGCCYADQFSDESLARQTWDEPVDEVVVFDTTSGEVRFYETRAREVSGLY